MGTNGDDGENCWWQRPFQSELWRQPDFARFWIALTLSGLGSQVASIAIPLVAIITLDASALEVGVLRAVQSAPALMFGLLAGAVVDRFRRQPVMVYSDAARALLLGLIPLAAIAGALNFWLLLVIGFTAASLRIFFDIASFSFLPAVLGRHRLVEGNSKIQGTYAATSMLGPGLGGMLVQALTAPFAILAGIIPGLVSALLIRSMRVMESAPDAAQDRAGMLQEIREGITFVLRHRLLKPLAISSAMTNVGFGMHVTVLILFMTRELALSPALVGVVFAASGPGFLTGALVADRVTGRLGIGKVLIGAQICGALPIALIPFISGPPLIASVLLAGLNLAGAGMAQASGITALSVRQSVTPDRMLGRTNATMRFVSWAGAPLAAIFAGGAAEIVGLRVTLFIAAIIILVAVTPLLTPSIRGLREMPDESESLLY